MSWSYSGDPSTSPLDAARFLTGDTDEKSPVLSNEELQFLLDLYGDNLNALYFQVFTAMAIKYSKAIKRSLGPQSEDPTSRLNFFQNQAKRYEDLIAQGSGLSQPAYSGPKVFYYDMQNNPPKRPPWGRRCH